MHLEGGGRPGRERREVDTLVGGAGMFPGSRRTLSTATWSKVKPGTIRSPLALNRSQ